MTVSFAGDDPLLAMTLGSDSSTIPVLEDVSAQPITVSVVVPVLNGIKYLPRTAPKLIEAAKFVGGVDITYVDTGSSDGTCAFLESLSPSGVRVLRCGSTSIGAARNFGARRASSAYLSFLDADCEIPRDYFAAALAVIHATNASATGCETEVPESAPWIERTWHQLHYVGQDRDVEWLNSANFFITRAAFERVRGFREDLLTGEDAEIGRRLRRAGVRIHESPRVKAIHLGNPTSVREFYRRNVWHGLGVFGTTSSGRVDRPTAVAAAQLVATLIGVGGLLFLSWPIPVRLSLLLACLLVAPLAAVAHRIYQTRCVPRLDAAAFLYWLYLWARLQALVIVITGGTARYKK